MVKLNLTTYCGKQRNYNALNEAARCRNPEIFHLLYENGIGVKANPISAAIVTYDVDSEKREEEKLETVKMLSKMPEFTTSTKVRICCSFWRQKSNLVMSLYLQLHTAFASALEQNYCKIVDFLMNLPQFDPNGVDITVCICLCIHHWKLIQFATGTTTQCL